MFSEQKYQIFILMRNCQQPKPRPSYLVLKNNQVKKDRGIKLTPIKELKEKITLMLPQEKAKSPEVPYSPQKLSSAITARFKSNHENSTKMRSSFNLLIAPSKIKNIRPVCVNSESLLNRIDRINQQKISNLLSQRKKISHSQNSQPTVSIAYQNLLPNTKFKRPSQATRQILRLTKIRELFHQMEEDDSNKKSRVVEKYSNLVVTPQKLTLKKGERYTRSVCKTEADEYFEEKEYQCGIRAERLRRLKLMPQTSQNKIICSQRKIPYYQIDRWNDTYDNPKSEFEDLFYVPSKNQIPQQKITQRQDFNKKQFDFEQDNAFITTRTNTNVEQI